MQDQIDKYTQKLIRDRSAVPGSIRFFAMDDVLIASQEDEWRPVFEAVLAELNVMGLLFAKPSLPFADYLVARAPKLESRIYPRDSEVKTFLHDIPFIRREASREGIEKAIIALLRERKGLIIEGVGLIASGTVTLEQAYIVYSSIFHAVFIKYLHDILEEGFLEPGEEEAFINFRDNWLAIPDREDLIFRKGLVPEDSNIMNRRSYIDNTRYELMNDMVGTGAYVVERGLVDSFFGNISFFHGDAIYISQTGASLDELPGLIDRVPMDNSSTCGITASSELAVHRRIYETTDYQTILHGHPKFSVIISMLCEKRGYCDIVDCGRDCPEVRMFRDVPIVSGEIGAGGIAKKVPPVVKDFGRALVFGHGPFCVGRSGFQEPLLDLFRIENLCREGYFKLLEAKLTR